MTDGFTHDAGPYVLGALPPEDRRAFEAHLEGCPACQAEVRGFAGLPGLLSRLPVEDVTAAPEPPAPVSVLPALLRSAGVQRRTRRRRAVATGIAAAILAAAGSAAATEVLTRPDRAETVQFARASAEIPASAEAVLTDVPGGTRIAMTCRYTGALDGRSREYVLRVVPKGGGQPAELGSWPVLSTADYEVVVVAPLPRGSIDLVEVTNATGKSLLTLRP